MLDDRILPSIREAYGNMRRDIWFMQDGAPAHKGLNVRHKLHEVFGNRVLGLGFRQEWPPRSPDLTPCDFFCGVASKTRYTLVHQLHWRYCENASKGSLID